MKQQILVKKASGDLVPFVPQKLRDSLFRSGAGEGDINRIMGEIQDMLYEGIPTKEIYKKAFSLLKKKSRGQAARYKLKRAIIELGPTGYPFEAFVGELLRNQGYKVQVGIIMQGHCVQHEVDVLAEKADRQYMIECKFHSDAGRKCDVKVPLYINSRFQDLSRQWKKLPENKGEFHQGWVVTNTRFSEDALRYGKCAGLNLVSWDYPKSGSLKERIDNSGLHPITCLSGINRKEKQFILEKDIVLCRDLQERSEILHEAGVMGRRFKKTMEEIRELLE